MRILFSWIAFKEDLVKSKKTGIISGPTLQLLFSEKFDVLHLFSSDKETQEKASKLKSYVEEHQATKGEFEKNRNICNEEFISQIKSEISDICFNVHIQIMTDII